MASSLTVISTEIKDNVNSVVSFPNASFLTVSSSGIQTSIGNVALNVSDSVDLSSAGIETASSAVQLFPAVGMTGFTVSGAVAGYATVPDL